MAGRLPYRHSLSTQRHVFAWGETRTGGGAGVSVNPDRIGIRLIVQLGGFQPVWLWGT